MINSYYVIFALLSILSITFMILYFTKNTTDCSKCTTDCSKCGHNDPTKKIGKCPSDFTGTLIRSWKGTDIIPTNEKGWSYFIGSDLTHGYVNYYQANPNLNDPSSNFYGSNPNQLKIQLSDVKNVSIDSVRLRSDSTWDYGLFVIDLEKIPYGQYIWPAFWLNGLTTGGSKDTWPIAGEIDIIEGGWDEGGSKTNTVSIHTEPGYSQPNLNLNNNGGNCNDCGGGPKCGYKTCGKGGRSNPPSGETCPFNACSGQWPKGKGYGEDFYNNGGGIYATQVNCDGTLKLWFVPSNNGKSTSYKSIQKILLSDQKLSSDILDNLNQDDVEVLNLNIKPDSSPYKNLQIVINTTICGDAFTGENNRDKCDPQTFYSPALFENSQWIINTINVYQ